MILKRLPFFIIGLLFTLSAATKETILAKVSRDDDPAIYYLGLETSDENQEILKFAKISGANENDKETIDASDIKNGGLILEQIDDNIVLQLKSKNFNPLTGGTILIDTLYSAVSGERKSYTIELTKINNEWKILSRKTPISTMLFEINTSIFVGPIGIKRITMK